MDIKEIINFLFIYNKYRLCYNYLEESDFMNKKIIMAFLLMFCVFFGANSVKAEEVSNINTTVSTANVDKCKIILSPKIKDKINWVLDIVKYGGAVLVVILGSVDFLKATLSDEDNASKKAFQRFLKRLIAAVLLFLLPLIIQLLFTAIDNPVIKIPGFNVNNPTCGIGVSE